MIKADHPNIIILYEIYQDNSHIDLIMEECKGVNYEMLKLWKKKRQTPKDLCKNLPQEFQTYVKYTRNLGN